MEENNLYKERLLIEFEELVTKIAKLNKTLEGVNPSEEVDLLRKQADAMEEYKRILAIRILKEMGRY